MFIAITSRLIQYFKFDIQKGNSYWGRFYNHNLIWIDTEILTYNQ